MKGASLLQKKDDQILNSTVMQCFVESIPDKSDDGAYSRIEIPERTVSNLVQAWRARAYYFPREIIADAAWGMLLEILQAEIKDQRMSLQELFRLSGLPESVAMRWLKVLENHDLAFRRADPKSMRDEFIELSPKGTTAIHSYFYDLIQFSSNLSAPG